MPKQTLSALISYLYGEVNGSWASIKDNIHPSDGEFSFNEWGKKKVTVLMTLLIVLWMMVSAVKKRHLQVILGYCVQHQWTE